MDEWSSEEGRGGQAQTHIQTHIYMHTLPHINRRGRCSTGRNIEVWNSLNEEVVSAKNVQNFNPLSPSFQALSPLCTLLPLSLKRGKSRGIVKEEELIQREWVYKLGTRGKKGKNDENKQ